MSTAPQFTAPVRGVELVDLGGRHTATVRKVQSEGIMVDMRADETRGVAPGHRFHLLLSSLPILPCDVCAKVVCISSVCDAHGEAVISCELVFLEMPAEQKAALLGRLRESLPLVVVYGVPVLPAATERVRVISARDINEVSTYCSEEEVAVLVVGERVTSKEAAECLKGGVAGPTTSNRVNVVIGTPGAADVYQELVDDDRLFYVSKEGLPSDQLRLLMDAAVDCYMGKEAMAPRGAALTGALPEWCIRIMAQEEAKSICAMLTECVQALMPCERCDCTVFNHKEHSLWGIDRATGVERSESAASGIVGFVARTAHRVWLSNAGQDPRLDRDVDCPGMPLNPGGFVAEPLVGGDGLVIGVIAVVRSASDLSFTAAEIKVLEVIAKYGAAALYSSILNGDAEKALTAASRGAKTELFREEALASHYGTIASEGRIMESTPRWLTLSHSLGVVFMCGLLLIATFIRSNQYASGPYIVRAKSRTGVVAPVAGTIRSVNVALGSVVRSGDVLMQIAQPSESQGEENNQVRAPQSGVIGDIDARVGGQVRSGQNIATLIEPQDGFQLIAALPAEFRSALHFGLSLRGVSGGANFTNVVLSVNTISATDLTASEAGRYLGVPERSMGTGGPFVLITAALPPGDAAFDASRQSSGGTFGGRVEIPVHSERLIKRLLPRLR